MKKKYIILLLLIIIVAAGSIAVLQSGWVVRPRWLPKTTRQKHQSMHNVLYTMAMTFAEVDIPPSTNGVEIIEAESDHWGTPIQYSYENGVPTLRAAGKDKELNTRDDITQTVSVPQP